MTAKFDAFKAALEALCREHRVTLASSLYDSPAVFDMDDDDEPIHQDDLLDKTIEPPAAG